MTIQMAGLLQENEDDAPNVTHQADEESKEDSEEDSDEESENVQEEAESGANSTDGAPIVWIRDQFRIYCEHAKKEFKPFTKEELIEAVGASAGARGGPHTRARR